MSWSFNVSRLFVTGTGTEVGKTFITCVLIRELRAAGCQVRALKPVISGFDSTNVAASDTGQLLEAMGDVNDSAAVGSVSPWRFIEPLSPNKAAEREGRSLDVGEIAGFCRYAGPAEGDTIVLIEGVGGVMVPLSDEETVLDWMTNLNWPIVLVAGSYLGTLSHTLTAVEAIKLRGLNLCGVVVSESKKSPMPLQETIDTLAQFITDTPVIAFPRRSTVKKSTTNPHLVKLLGLIDTDTAV